jgi:DNA gyrase/topoisomerase IV subunit A
MASSKRPNSPRTQPAPGGIIALTLDDNDELIRVGLRGDHLGTRQGYALRFNEADARSIGRTARGVIGIRLEEGDEVIGMEVLNPGSSILTVSESGYGKRTSATEYRVQGRGGKGLINLNVKDRAIATAGPAHYGHGNGPLQGSAYTYMVNKQPRWWRTKTPAGDDDSHEEPGRRTPDDEKTKCCCRNNARGLNTIACKNNLFPLLKLARQWRCAALRS